MTICPDIQFIATANAYVLERTMRFRPLIHVFLAQGTIDRAMDVEIENPVDFPISVSFDAYREISRAAKATGASLGRIAGKIIEYQEVKERGQQ